MKYLAETAAIIAIPFAIVTVKIALPDARIAPLAMVTKTPAASSCHSGQNYWYSLKNITATGFHKMRLERYTIGHSITQKWNRK
jgi:hypothetical protein